MAPSGESEAVVNARIVYWGVDGAGKRTNLEVIHQKLRPDHRGELRQIPTRLDPTVTSSMLPIELGDVPVDGATLAATASGDLTIHGVTLPVEVPIEAQLTGDTIVVVASIPVVFADYDIASPSSLNLLSVEDNGVIEMQLLFTRA